MRRNRVALIALLAFLIAQVAQAERPWLVGDLGDLSRIEFRGNESYSSEKLVSALDTDFALLAPSRPLASLATLLTTIRHELLHGYRHNGFPEATVTVDYDETAQGIVAEIVEGRQYHNGPVLVEGVSDELAQLLIERLTEDEQVNTLAPAATKPPQAGVQPQVNQQRQALWKDNEPTSFSPYSSREIEKRSIESLQDAGYLEATASIRLEPIPATCLTELRVTVALGQATSIGQIAVTGIERHTPEEIISFLGIEVGMPCDLFTRRQWESRLEASGRFAAHTVTISPIADEPGRQSVTISLNECEEVPTLGEPLSEVDLALLRACEWLKHPENFAGDVCVHGTGDLQTLCGYLSGVFDGTDETAAVTLPAWLDGATASFRLALSPQGESVLAASVASPQGESLFGYAFDFSSTHTAIASTGTSHYLRFDSDADDAGPRANANITFLRTPTSPEGHKFGMTFGMGVSSAASGLLQIQVTPAFMLSHAQSETSRFEIRDGILFAEWEGVRSQFDAATGRLSRCECESEDGALITVEVLPHGLADVREQVELAAAATRSDIEHPPALALSVFVTDEIAWWAHRLDNETEAVRWEAVGRILRNYDAGSDVETVAFTRAEQEGDDERFFIPASETIAANPLSWIGSFVLMGNTGLLSRGSPAWQVGREAVAAMLLRDSTAFAELERLSRDDRCGPLTSLYAAELLRFVHPALEKAWAERGLRRLDAVLLAGDLNHITSVDTPFGKFLAELMRELDRLPPEELRAVFAGVGDEWLGNAITIVTESSVAPETRVQQLVQLLWMAGLKDCVEDRLADHLRSGMETTQR